MDGVCWAVEPKTCLSGKHNRLLGGSVLEKDAALGRESSSLLVWNAAAFMLQSGAAQLEELGGSACQEEFELSGSHPSLAQETLALLALDTGHKTP